MNALFEKCIRDLRAEAGVFANPFVPSRVQEGKGLLRTSFTAAHTPALIDEASDIIAEALKC